MAAHVTGNAMNMRTGGWTRSERMNAMLHGDATGGDQHEDICRVMRTEGKMT